jgi:hypothetical protein
MQTTNEQATPRATHLLDTDTLRQILEQQMQELADTPSLNGVSFLTVNPDQKTIIAWLPEPK